MGESNSMKNVLHQEKSVEDASDNQVVSNSEIQITHDDQVIDAIAEVDGQILQEEDNFGAIEDEEELETDSPVIRQYQIRDDIPPAKVESDLNEIERLISRYEVIDETNEVNGSNLLGEKSQEDDLEDQVDQ
jgi:hypothetical protein